MKNSSLNVTLQYVRNISVYLNLISNYCIKKDSRVVIPYISSDIINKIYSILPKDVSRLNNEWLLACLNNPNSTTENMANEDLTNCFNPSIYRMIQTLTEQVALAREVAPCSQIRTSHHVEKHSSHIILQLLYNS